MPRKLPGDAASVEKSATDLLQRYRTLCEARGLARANRLPLDSPLDVELKTIEAQLLSRLAPSKSEPTAAGSDVTGSSLEQVDVAENQTGSADPGIPDTSVANSAAPPEEPTTGKGIAATLFVDGAAEGNPGPGGYGVIVRIAGRPDQELAGGAAHTTNNKMELCAAIAALRAAIDAGATELTVMSDSEYLVKGMTRWLGGWLAKNWLTTEKQPVKNRDLWEQLAELTKSRTVHWMWIRGHAGHPENERCDRLATEAARQAGRKHVAL